MNWSEQDIELVRKRAGQGWSAAAIAAEFGEMGKSVTRNAVIGRAHRSGISLGAPKSSKPRAAQRKRKMVEVAKGVTVTVGVAKPSRPLEKPPQMEFIACVSSKPVLLVELNNQVCKWPLGGFAARPPYMYCGDPVFVGCYCMRHFQISIKGSKETADATGESAVIKP